MTDTETTVNLAAELVLKTQPMELILSAPQVLALAGVVQLALRHPRLDGEPRETSQRFMAGVREYFADCPTVLDVLRRGADPLEDIQ